MSTPRHPGPGCACGLCDSDRGRMIREGVAAIRADIARRRASDRETRPVLDDPGHGQGSGRRNGCAPLRGSQSVEGES